MTEEATERERARVRAKVRKVIVIVPLALGGLLLFVAVGGEVVRRLWNWLLPPLLGVDELTFWQALGMLALCRILFGGFGMGGGSRPSRRRTSAAESAGP
jgi:hypothetical protein